MDNKLEELEAEIKHNDGVKEELQKQLIDIKNQEFDNEKINDVIEVLESVINNVFAISDATIKINLMVAQVSKSVTLMMNSHTNITSPLISGIMERLDVVEQELGLYIDEDEVDLSNMRIEEMKEELERLNDEFPDE